MAYRVYTIQCHSNTRLEMQLAYIEGCDGLRWQLKQSGVFDVKSFSMVLWGSCEVKFPRKGILCVKAPWRVSFFVWTAAWGKLLTCDNLMKRGHTQ